MVHYLGYFILLYYMVDTIETPHKLQQISIMKDRYPLRRRHLQPPPSPKPAHRGFTGHPKAALTAGRSLKPCRVYMWVLG